MTVISTQIPDVKILEPKVFADSRGFFFESFNEKIIRETLGLHENFVQDNHSYSVKGVLRGLHYQIRNPQGKLVRVVTGEAFDVAVDMRKSSPSFGKWVGVHLSASNKRILWVPPGFAHGFLVLSEGADFLYKTTNFYDPASERCLLWNDPDVGIEWPFEGTPLLSPKDNLGKSLKEAELFL